MPAGTLNIVNRDTYPLFVPSPVEVYPTKTRVSSVRFKKVSPDEKYERLKKKGLNIDISNSEITVNGKKPMDGIFSPLFGADSTQDTPIFTCDCHKLTGGVNVGRVCPDCGTTVRTIEADLRIMGHIDIAPYHILTFHGYQAFKKIFKNMDEIITTTRRINRAGKVVDNGIPTLMELYDDYNKVYAERIGLDRNIVFMTKIPVYSSRLRPLMEMGRTTLTILDVNKHYLSAVNLANILKSTTLMPAFSRDIEIQRTLNQLQQEINGVFKIIMEQINGKSGVFRRALASGRLDNSSRLVITLGTDLKAHEVDVPYQTMMEQYEGEIAKYLSRIQDIPISKAITMVEENKMERNELFVNIINQLLKNGLGKWILDNRNPTISEYGIQYVKIRKIHDDPTDMTLHLPQDVLALLAADFDGDQATTVGRENVKYHKYFLTMCPTYAFIDRADGKFNRSMSFMKDYAALIATAWDLDSAYDNYLCDPEESAYAVLERMGLAGSNPELHTTRSEEIAKLLFSSKTTGSFKERYVDPSLNMD
ncbi:MAG: hypothetical protein NC489_16565 [Ruminococcus flavefaciens]|nr:hypothetical protein [Ruminococcus flavefaciens]